MHPRSRTSSVAILLSTCVIAAVARSQGVSFPVTSIVNPPPIAGRAAELDRNAKLLPWPMPDNIGYSYSAYFLSQWTIVWDQYNRQRLPYYFCCFDFDRTSFEMFPEWHWANSTG